MFKTKVCLILIHYENVKIYDLNLYILLAYLFLAENYKSHSTNRESQYREERSAQNNEESGAISTGTSKSKQDVDPKR